MATSTSGTAKRTVRASASTSPVLRVTRSPVPARSTVDSGSDSTRSRKSSRSSANTVSPSTNDALRATTRSAPSARASATASSIASRSTCSVVVPSLTDCDDVAEQPRARRPRPARPERCSASIQTQRPAVVGEAARCACARTCGAGRRPGSVAPRRSQRPPLGSRCRGSRGGRRAGRGGCRAPPPGRRARRRPRRSGRAAAGWRWSPRSCGPPPPVPHVAGRRSRLATSTSVCASTALVGSTSTSTSASASSARASASRCRWPPENARPPSSTCASSPPAAPPARRRPRRTRSAARSRRRRRPGPTGPARRAASPVNSRGSASDTSTRRRTVAQRQVARAGRRRGVTPSSSASRPSRCAMAADSSGSALTSAGHQTRLDGEPRTSRPSSADAPAGGSAAGRRARRSPGRSSSTPMIRRGADQRAGDLVGGLDRGADRHDEEEGVAVERDDVADVERCPRARAARRARSRSDQEDARAAAPAPRPAVACSVATRTPASRSSSERRAVAGEERRLAADAAQHPQAGDGVRAERGQLARPPRAARAGGAAAGAAAGRAAPPSPARRRSTTSAEQHGRRQQQHGDDDVGHDRAGEPGRDVERAADVRARRWWPPRPPRRSAAGAGSPRRPRRCAGRAAAWSGTTRAASWPRRPGAAARPHRLDHGEAEHDAATTAARAQVAGRRRPGLRPRPMAAGTSACATIQATPKTDAEEQGAATAAAPVQSR